MAFAFAERSPLPVPQGDFRLHEERQHQLRASAHCARSIAASLLQHFHRLFAQFRLVRGENRESLKRHRPHRDTIFHEPGPNQRQQTKALGAADGIVCRGDDHIAASLPFFHWQLCSDRGENIAVAGKDDRFPPAYEPSQLSGATMLERIVRAEFPNQIPNSNFSGPDFS